MDREWSTHQDEETAPTEPPSHHAPQEEQGGATGQGDATAWSGGSALHADRPDADGQALADADARSEEAAADGADGSLTRLEKRWERMAEAIRALRGETESLKAQLEEKEAGASDREGELERLTRQVADLQEEKGRIIARIEGLLSRFDTLEL